MEHGQLSGRVALVSGGGRGIGRSIAELLATHGAAVAVNYRRDRDAAGEVVAGIRSRGGRAKAYEASVVDPDTDRAALEALARTLAKEELRYGIHVNIVAPGLVETDMGVRLARAMTGDRALADLRSLDERSPFGRVCQPLDVVNVVLWLCSDAAGYVTGQRIECDGGATA